MLSRLPGSGGQALNIKTLEGVTQLSKIITLADSSGKKNLKKCSTGFLVRPYTGGYE